MRFHTDLSGNTEESNKMLLLLNRTLKKKNYLINIDPSTHTVILSGLSIVLVACILKNRSLLGNEHIVWWGVAIGHKVDIMMSEAHLNCHRPRIRAR